MEKEVGKKDQSEEKAEGVSTFKKFRYSHKFRLGFILFLMAVVAILFVVWEKARIALVVAFIALFAAFGLEVSKTDWDLQNFGILNPSNNHRLSAMLKEISFLISLETLQQIALKVKKQMNTIAMIFLIKPRRNLSF